MPNPTDNIVIPHNFINVHSLPTKVPELLSFPQRSRNPLNVLILYFCTFPSSAIFLLRYGKCTCYSKEDHTIALYKDNSVQRQHNRFIFNTFTDNPQDNFCLFHCCCMLN